METFEVENGAIATGTKSEKKKREIVSKCMRGKRESKEGIIVCLLRDKREKAVAEVERGRE